VTVAITITREPYPSAHTSPYSLWAPPKAANVAKLIRRRRISLKRDNHPQRMGGGIAKRYVQ
jgi:hypothetical protein